VEGAMDWKWTVVVCGQWATLMVHAVQLLCLLPVACRYHLAKRAAIRRLKTVASKLDPDSTDGIVHALALHCLSDDGNTDALKKRFPALFFGHFLKTSDMSIPFGSAVGMRAILWSILSYSLPTLFAVLITLRIEGDIPDSWLVWLPLLAWPFVQVYYFIGSGIFTSLKGKADDCETIVYHKNKKSNGLLWIIATYVEAVIVLCMCRAEGWVDWEWQWVLAPVYLLNPITVAIVAVALAVLFCPCILGRSFYKCYLGQGFLDWTGVHLGSDKRLILLALILSTPLHSGLQITALLVALRAQGIISTSLGLLCLPLWLCYCCVPFSVLILQSIGQDD